MLVSCLGSIAEGLPEHDSAIHGHHCVHCVTFVWHTQGMAFVGIFSCTSAAMAEALTHASAGSSAEL